MLSRILKTPEQLHKH